MIDALVWMLSQCLAHREVFSRAPGWRGALRARHRVHSSGVAVREYALTGWRNKQMKGQIASERENRKTHHRELARLSLSHDAPG